MTRLTPETYRAIHDANDAKRRDAILPPAPIVPTLAPPRPFVRLAVVVAVAAVVVPVVVLWVLA